MINTIVRGDCLKIMQDIPDKSIDLILADPPFGTTKNNWDILVDPDAMWEQYKRIIKDNCPIILFGIQPYSSTLITTSKGWYKYQWIWEKSQAGNFAVAKHMPLSVAEDILVFGKGKVTYNPQMTPREKPRKNGGTSSDKNGRGFNGIKNVYTISNETYPRNILRYPTVVRKQSLHPSQKPVELLEYLIKTHSNKDAVILDSFCGSGSTIIAALKQSRNYIGIELSESYFQMTLKRVKEHQHALAENVQHNAGNRLLR